MYFKNVTSKSCGYTIENPFLSPLGDFQEKQDIVNSLISKRATTKTLFQKSSRICRDMIISDIRDFCDKYEVTGETWGLFAARPVFYLEALPCSKNFTNFEINKDTYKYLKKQKKGVDSCYSEKGIIYNVRNENILDSEIKDNENRPAIVEMDIMGSLKRNYEKILFFIKEKLSSNIAVFSVTSSIGRHCGTQEEYKKLREKLKEDIALIRPILDFESIEYAETNNKKSNHCHPMRTEIFVLKASAGNIFSV